MMNEQQLTALKLALEALECIPTSGSMLGSYAEQKRIKAITALKSIISQDALDKKADNARELGLSYDHEPAPVQEPLMVDMQPPATQRDRWMYEQGRLAERDPRSHADIAWELAEKVRRDLDRQSCPGVYMNLAMESIVKHYTTPPAQSSPVQETCSKCHGLGYYDEGHENDDGSMSGGNCVECEKCKPPAAQPALPPMRASGLVAIKTLLSRDPCAHAKVAIEMIDEMLKENT